MLLYEEYYKQPDKVEFLKKVVYYASLLKLPPNWLMQVMYIESTVNPAAPTNYNGKGAVGLIGFMPKTLEGLKGGYTPQQVRTIS